MSREEYKDRVEAVLVRLEGTTADLGEVLEYLGLQNDHEVRRLVGLQAYKCASCKRWALRRIGTPCKPPAEITPDWKCDPCRKAEKKVDAEWAFRSTLTIGDLEFLRACGIAWDAPRESRQGDLIYLDPGANTSAAVEGIIALLKEWDVPVTRETILDMAYMGNPPKEIDPEFEAELEADSQEEQQ